MEKNNTSLGYNKFSLTINNTKYLLNLQLLNEEEKIEIVLINQDSMDNYSEKFNFNDINSTQCFKFEENLEEILAAMNNYVAENLMKIEAFEGSMKMTFEALFNKKKKLISEFILNRKEQDIQIAAKMMKKKINDLMKDNKEKDARLNKLKNDKKKNEEKMQELEKELIKMKDKIHNNKMYLEDHLTELESKQDNLGDMISNGNFFFIFFFSLF